MDCARAPLRPEAAPANGEAAPAPNILLILQQSGFAKAKPLHMHNKWLSQAAQGAGEFGEYRLCRTGQRGTRGGAPGLCIGGRNRSYLSIDAGGPGWVDLAPG